MILELNSFQNFKYLTGFSLVRRFSPSSKFTAKFHATTYIPLLQYKDKVSLPIIRFCGLYLQVHLYRFYIGVDIARTFQNCSDNYIMLCNIMHYSDYIAGRLYCILYHLPDIHLSKKKIKRHSLKSSRYICSLIFCNRVVRTAFVQ